MGQSKAICGNASYTTWWPTLQTMLMVPPDDTTCIGSKFGHQVAPSALFATLVTRLHHCFATLPWIVPLALSVGIALVSSSARVTSVKSQQVALETQTHRSDPRYTWGQKICLPPGGKLFVIHGLAPHISDKPIKWKSMQKRFNKMCAISQRTHVHLASANPPCQWSWVFSECVLTNLWVISECALGVLWVCSELPCVALIMIVIWSEYCDTQCHWRWAKWKSQTE